VDLVVLLHGLWRSRWSMAWPLHRLRAAGFHAVAISYPSRSQSIDGLSRFVAARLPDPADGRLHFVTHSLGGLVVRHLIRTTRPAWLGRVVMMAPPNQGSRLARRLARSRVMRALAGPVGPLLASAPDEIARALGPVDFELGVIAGHVQRSVLAGWLAGPSDGRLLIPETHVEGMTDVVTVRRCHALLMNDARAIEQTVHFLRHGSFDRSAG
jgi:alpha-beta hydrolase superfamily lysophospholipase